MSRFSGKGVSVWDGMYRVKGVILKMWKVEGVGGRVWRVRGCGRARGCGCWRSGSEGADTQQSRMRGDRMRGEDKDKEEDVDLQR